MPDGVSSVAVTSVTLLTLNPHSRDSPSNASPVSSSPTRDSRGSNLFRAIGRRLGRHRIRHDNDVDDEASQSSTDSEERSSESAGGRISNRSKKTSGTKKAGFLHRSASCTGSTSGLLHFNSTGSSGGSSSGSDLSNAHLPRHNNASPSSSLRQRSSSFKKVFHSLTRRARSHSVTGAPASNPTADTNRRVSDSDGKRLKDRSILRAPIAYTYVKGLSGLPTQRVPRGYTCVYLPSVVCCGPSKFGAQQFPGLNR
jgi:hypothetical protein